MALKRRGFAIACVALAGVAAACGIDEVGLATGDSGMDVIVPNEGGGPDVNADVPLPPSCATTDVSCLGLDAGVPDGWAAYFLVGDGGCPAGDFGASNWVTNATLAPGACACGCTPTTGWSCPTTINLANGATCGGFFTVDAGDCQPANSAHVELEAGATATGAQCTPDASAAVAQSDTVTLCSAGCDAGPGAICGQPAGTRCIATDGVQPCPDGFTQHIVGASATAACDPCTCSPGTPPACAAVATAYYGYFQHPNTTCQTGGQYTTQTVNLDGTCQSTNFFYDSLSVSWAPLPPAGCQPSSATGDAGVTAPKTVCCK